jgi:hypothetical protein
MQNACPLAREPLETATLAGEGDVGAMPCDCWVLILQNYLHPFSEVVEESWLFFSTVCGHCSHRFIRGSGCFLLVQRFSIQVSLAHA